MVGEFTPDPAVAPAGARGKDGDARAGDGQPRLGQHGIRVGDVVRVNDVSAGSMKKVGKEKGKEGPKDGGKDGPEGVVTRVNEKAIWIAFGQRGGGGRSKEEDEAIEDLWGKKLWAYVPSLQWNCSFADWDAVSNLPMMLRIDGKNGIRRQRKIRAELC